MFVFSYLYVVNRKIVKNITDVAKIVIKTNKQTSFCGILSATKHLLLIALIIKISNKHRNEKATSQRVQKCTLVGS